jgi:poly(hydroxyalkanoate) granule-associated protein
MTKSNVNTRKKSIATPSQNTTSPNPQHIWLAGLGAMAKAQEQGSKAIEALVNEGLSFQRKSQAEAQLRLQEATERLTHIASDFGQQASGRVDKLEHLFEDRVAKALHRLGMPSPIDMQILNDRVAQLEERLAALLPKAATKTVAKGKTVPSQAQTSGTAKRPKKTA